MVIRNHRWPEIPDSCSRLNTRYHFTTFADSYGQADLPWTVGAFIDWARVGVNDPLFFESDHNLLGIGVEYKFFYPVGLYARFDLAKPMRELKVGGNVIDGTESSDYRVHGNPMEFKRSMRNNNKKILSLLSIVLGLRGLYGLPEGTEPISGVGSFASEGNMMTITAPDGSVFSHGSFNVEIVERLSSLYSQV